MTGVWLVLTALAAPPSVPPVVAPSQPAQLAQVVLPALATRAAVAEARSEAAGRYFAGTAPLGEAFPELAGAPILDRAALVSRLAHLQSAARDRAQERVAPPPTSDATLATRWERSRAGALDAEDRADVLLERVLVALLATVEAAPELTDAAVAPRIESWRADRAALVPAEGGELPVADADAIGALAQAEQSLTALRAAAVRAATVPGDTTLSAIVERDLDPPGAESEIAREARLDRLVRVAPLLDPTRAERARALAVERARAELERRRAELEAHRDALTGALAAAPSEAPEAPVEALEQRHADAVTHLEQLRTATAPPDADPLARERAGVRTLEIEVAAQEAELARLRLERARAAQTTGGEGAAASAERAEEARKAADAAADAATDARRQGALGQLRLRVAELHAASADVYGEEATRRKEALEHLDAMRTTLDARIEASAGALSLPPLDSSRRGAIDQAYLDLRSSVLDAYALLDGYRSRVRAAQAEQSEQLAEIESRGRAWTAIEASPELAELLIQRGEAVAAVEDAYGRRVANLRTEQDAGYALLVRARDARRAIRGEASRSARVQARRDFVPELAREVTAIPGQLLSGLRALGDLPKRLLDLSVVWGFVRHSFELVLILGAWWLARARTDAWIPALWAWLRERIPGASVRGGPATPPPEAPGLGQQLLDVLLGALLVGWLTPETPTLGLLALVWVAAALWRAAPLAARTLLSTPDEARMALRIVSGSTRELLGWTARVFVAWWFVARIATYVALHLLDADRLRDLASTLGSMAFWILVVWALARWSDTVRSTLAAQEEQNRLTRWLAQPPRPGPIGTAVETGKTALAVGTMSVYAAVHGFQRAVEGRTGLGWLQAAIARRQVRADPEDHARVPLPSETLDRVARDAGARVERPVAVRQVREAFAGWTADHRRGLVSLSGEHGMGKTALLHGLAEFLQTDLPVVIGGVQTRIRTEEGALSWLADTLGVSRASTSEALAAHVASLEPRVVALDDIHNLFLRCVGGSAPLRVVLDVLQATSERHFYVVASHGWAWSYLLGIGTRLRLDAFRTHIVLDRIGDEAMAGWLEGCLRESRLELAWDELAEDGALGADRHLIERRARAAYFRLLADAAQGNPDVALPYFLTSLCVSEREGVAQMRMFRAPSPDDVSDLDDHTLLALTALTVHDGATVEELSLALNRNLAGTRAACRNLDSLGLAALEHATGRYTVQTIWRPAVARLLRQKHFLHWS